MYGEAPVTLSESIITLALSLIVGVMLVSFGIPGKVNVNFLSLVIPVITLGPEYHPEDIPEIRTASSTDNPCAASTSTDATRLLEVTFVIAIEDSDRSPTILNSGLFGSKSVDAG